MSGISKRDLKHILNTVVCKLQGDQNADLSTLETLIETTNELLQELIDKPQIESLNPIRYCNETGTTGYVAYQYDEETGEVITIYLDAAGQVTTTPPTGDVCYDDDFEFKFFESIKCTEDGTEVKEVTCILYINGVQESSDLFWIIDGQVTTVPPTLVDCNICNPMMESFLGDNASLEEFHKFSLEIPPCCEVTITTSAGTYIFDSHECIRHVEEEFDCPVSNYTIQGDCVDDIRTYLIKKQ